MIDVAHDGDHRRAPLAILIDSGLLDVVRGFLFVAELVGGSAEIARQLLGQLYVEGLVDGGENLLIHQPLHHHVALDAELFRKLLYGDAFGDGDLAIDGRRLERLLLRRETGRMTTLFRIHIAAAVARSRLGRMTAAGIGGQRRGFGAQVRRSRMHRTAAPAHATGTAGGPPTLVTMPGPRINGLARTHRAGINRTVREPDSRGAVGIPGRGAPERPAAGRTGQPRDHIGTRRNHGPRGGLSG